MIRKIFYVVLAVIMLGALVASFFPTPGVPDYAYAMGRTY